MRTLTSVEAEKDQAYATGQRDLLRSLVAERELSRTKAFMAYQDAVITLNTTNITDDSWPEKAKAVKTTLDALHAEVTKDVSHDRNSAKTWQRMILQTKPAAPIDPTTIPPQFRTTAQARAAFIQTAQKMQQAQKSTESNNNNNAPTAVTEKKFTDTFMLHEDYQPSDLLPQSQSTNTTPAAVAPPSVATSNDNMRIKLDEEMSRHRSFRSSSERKEPSTKQELAAKYQSLEDKASDILYSDAAGEGDLLLSSAGLKLGDALLEYELQCNALTKLAKDPNHDMTVWVKQKTLTEKALSTLKEHLTTASQGGNALLPLSDATQLASFASKALVVINRIENPQQAVEVVTKLSKLSRNSNH